MSVIAGDNVILNTPTGSGKSLVALAGHFAALARGERSFYTAPIKALVAEKFFELCSELGSDRVGMLTGDAAVNPTAPVVCCTAEVLANMALRDGTRTDVDRCCMDEFHFYADRDRGWAWQVPLLELGDPRFLLMSATLGDVRFFERELTERTGRPTVVVKSTERPVPLDFSYRESPVHETVGDLLETNKSPVYIVHFTQKAAAERAQALTSMDLIDKETKAALKDAVGDFRFDTPIGGDLRRWVLHGVGVHHAGMLPKYRLLVEKLAQQALLHVICGTDTLGVGVNVPIRTVSFTQLCKWDGEKTRVLSVREFQQIAGRAGRRGFDTRGSIVVQAPEHVVENRRIDAKAAADPKRHRKAQKKRPPERGYAHWDAKTLERLSTSEPETLTSSFLVSHSMMLNLLDRPGDGCAAAKRLLLNSHEPRPRTRQHIRRAISIYRSLVAGEIIEHLDEPDEDGRRLRVTVELQDDFSLNQPLSPFVLHAVPLLERDDFDYALDVLTIVESVLENPSVVLFAQLDRRKTELIAELKADGVDYDERMRQLDEVEWPKPRREFIYDTFDAWRGRHLWIGNENIRPKSIAREMYEAGDDVQGVRRRLRAQAF